MASSDPPAGAHALTAAPTSLERRWHLSFERLRPLLQQPCEAAVSASLHSLVHDSDESEREVAQALLYGMLTQPHVGAPLFRLVCCLRDLDLAVTEIEHLVIWRYASLHQAVKQQLLWLLSQVTLPLPLALTLPLPLALTLTLTLTLLWLLSQVRTTPDPDVGLPLALTLTLTLTPTLLWLLSQLVRSRVAGAHRLALALLRQVGAADCSPPNPNPNPNRDP